MDPLRALEAVEVVESSEAVDEHKVDDDAGFGSCDCSYHRQQEWAELVEARVGIA